MNFRGAILKEDDLGIGIVPNTFSKLEDVYKYLEPKLQRIPAKKECKVIEEETYQYVLDNETKVRSCMEQLQLAFEEDGYLNNMEIADLIMILMENMSVKELAVEDRTDNDSEEDGVIAETSKE